MELEKWVEDFASCEEILDEVLEKLHLVIRERIPFGTEEGGEAIRFGNFKIFDEGGGG